MVIDAGIATEANLELLEAKGYDYVCVSRKGIKDFRAVEGTSPQMISTKNKQELTVQRVVSSQCTDYYLTWTSQNQKGIIL